MNFGSLKKKCCLSAQYDNESQTDLSRLASSITKEIFSEIQKLKELLEGTSENVEVKIDFWGVFKEQQMSKHQKEAHKHVEPIDDEEVTIAVSPLILYFSDLLSIISQHHIIIRQSYPNMISIAASELEHYNKKMNRLEIEVFTLQEELLNAKAGNGDQYKIKYQLLLDKLAEESQLKESKRNQTLMLQEKNLNDANQKWESLLSEKVNEFTSQIQTLSLEKSSFKNRVVQLEIKTIRLQKEIDEGDTQIMKIKLQAIKKENDRLRKENSELYSSREYAIEQMKNEVQIKIESTKQRQKTFYRDQIEALQMKIEEIYVVLESERQKISPERQKLIHTLESEILTLKSVHETQIERLTALLQKRNRELATFREQTEKKERSNFEMINDLTNEVKSLEQRLFKSNFEKQMQIKQIQIQLSLKRQNQADDLKQQLDRLNAEFDRERNEWKKIIDQAQDNGSLLRKGFQQQKQKFIEQKNRYKTKIAELKMRLKEKGDEKGNGQTQLLIKSLKEMNNNEEQFSSYENAITFMDRQVRKATIKIEEKNREINNLLDELKTIQQQTQVQISQVKQKAKNEQKKLYDRIFEVQQVLDDLQQQLREKDKYIKRKQADLNEQQDGHKVQVDNLKKIIEEMERDYKRLTGNKKNLEDSYRQERENVISGKLDINQQKKKKWVELLRQRNELEIVYREREMQIKGEFETQIDKLKRQKQRYIEEKEEYRAEVELLKERLNEGDQQNKENKVVEYQKKLATLDLEIALTQNLFNTLSNATSKQGQTPRSELQEMSEGQSSKIGSSQSFEVKVTGAITPPFTSVDFPKEDIYKGATFSFTPYNANK